MPEVNSERIFWRPVVPAVKILIDIAEGRVMAPTAMGNELSEPRGQKR